MTQTRTPAAGRPRSSTGGTAARKPTQRQFAQVLDMAERLADEANEAQAQLAALVEVERKRRERMAGVPTGHDRASLQARYDHLARMMGEAVFTPEPGKFGGLTASEQRRIEEARARRARQARGAK